MHITPGHVEIIDGVETTVIPFWYLRGTGNLVEMYDDYHLQAYGPSGSQTLVSYEAWVDLGFRAPDSLVNWDGHRVLPGVLTGLEERAMLRHATALQQEGPRREG